MRVVADTNVLVSAFLWNGIPTRVIAAAELGRIQLYTSPALMKELEKALAYPKFTTNLRELDVTPKWLHTKYAELAHLIAAPPIPPVVKEDPDDDAVLACALAAQADYLVTGDSLLLRLVSYGRTRIVTPRVFITAVLH